MNAIPQGNVTREAVDSLGGYAYQLYRSALAWLDLEVTEFLLLEVAEDFATVAENRNKCCASKEDESRNVTINSKDIVATIDSFVTLAENNTSLEVKVIHLTTSSIGKEKSADLRIGQKPTLESWKNLSVSGNLAPLRKILNNSKLSAKTKNYLNNLNDQDFRNDFLMRISFECGALESEYTLRLLKSKLSNLILSRRGVNSQTENCLNRILVYLLKLSSQKQDRITGRTELEEIIESATHIPVNISLFENQMKQSLSLLSIPGDFPGGLAALQLSRPKPIDNIPFPKAIANRQDQSDKIISAIKGFRLAWIYGTSGVGKTLGAKLAAKVLGGNWRVLNLRGFDPDQACLVINIVASELSGKDMGGLILDDLDNLSNPRMLDSVLYLYYACENYGLPLIVTTTKQLPLAISQQVGLPSNVAVKITEFNESDIEEILKRMKVTHYQKWVKYIYFVSGGGHPQLAIATIQTLQSNQWDENELLSMNSLLKGNSATEQVKASTRQRLYEELPDKSRKLLERLSLKLGSFDRNLVLKISEIDPSIPEPGNVLDQLVGSWIDQQAQDQFSLSPLLSGFAETNLSENQRKIVHFEIANIILEKQVLNPTDANSATFSALLGCNTEAITNLCMGIIGSSEEDYESIALHVPILTSIQTERVAYEQNAFASALLRGVQLILFAHSANQDKMLNALNCFKSEVRRLEIEEQKNNLNFIIFTKIMMSNLKSGAIPKFWTLLSKLNESTSKLSPDIRSASEISLEENLGFIFINQMRQLKTIDSLEQVFVYLDDCSDEFREQLLRPLGRNGLDVEMVFAGAWLSEDKADSIAPDKHEAVFSRVESYANKWYRKDIAVAARKYRAIILDEGANEKEKALKLIDEGFSLYGQNNHELVRAKAKIYYRAKDHKNSVNLSKILIENNAPLTITEKAFLGREAGISAENEGDYKSARKFYLYGRESARASKPDDMHPMEIGLLADAALASWHDGDRLTCLRDMSHVFNCLVNLDKNSSLRAAHCHAVSKHVALWLMQESSGEKLKLGNDELAQIFPGVVSNPEPHADIKKYAEQIEFGWYSLAAAENYCVLDAGITQDLSRHLLKGPVLEGKLLLTSSLRYRSFASLDVDLFIHSINDTLKEFVYFSNSKDEKFNFDPKNPTYGEYPTPTEDEKNNFQSYVQQFVLIFILKCVFESNFKALDLLVEVLETTDEIKVNNNFIDCLISNAEPRDYNSWLATLICQVVDSLKNNFTLSPRPYFQLVFHAFKVAENTKYLKLIAPPAVTWFRNRWSYIWANQKFHLSHPNLYEREINDVISSSFKTDIDELKALLLATLPTMGFNNESQVREMIKNIETQ